MQLKKSFSLIELTITIGISTMVLVGVTNFLLYIIQQNNKIVVETEIRNEANYILEQIVRDLRLTKCFQSGGTQYIMFSDPACSPGSEIATYDYTIDELSRNGRALNSDSVALEECSSCSDCLGEGTGLVITQQTDGNYRVELYLRQAVADVRSDFCGRLAIDEVVKPRTY